MRLAVEASAPGEPSAGIVSSSATSSATSGSTARRSRSAGYAPALEGLDQALRRGETDAAIELLRRADAASADPGPPAALGDALALVGRHREAGHMGAGGRSGAAVRRVRRPQRHGDGRVRSRPRSSAPGCSRARARGLPRAAERRGHARARVGVCKNGHCSEARRFSDASMRLGTKDVDGLFHRRLIERCLGDRPASERYLARVRARPAVPADGAVRRAARRVRRGRGRRRPSPVLQSCGCRSPS